MRLRKDALKRANKKIGYFTDLGNLEPEAKRKLIQAVRRVGHQLALIDESEQKVREALTLGLFLWHSTYMSEGHSSLVFRFASNAFT